MKTYTPEELKVVLAKHSAWWRSEPVGERAKLSGAKLNDANLYGADLRGANLQGAYLFDADLRCANLERVNLEGANLHDANLAGANLEGANLSEANLEGACLLDANLYDANLVGASLNGADLKGVNLRGANLIGATLDERFVRSRQIVCEGDLIVWKKLRGNTLAKLKIPAEAKRVGGLTGRKCRAEYAVVLEVIGPVSRSLHNPELTYTVGEIVRPDSFDPDPRMECAPGIHFFLTREEAEDYVG